MPEPDLRGSSRDAVDYRPSLIEDHALIGNMRTAALVSKDGCIDWLCLPRFDSEACFTALLGTGEHGYWKIAPRSAVSETRRHYRGDTLILETEWSCESGTVKLIDFMPPGEVDTVVRCVEGLHGEVAMLSRLKARFGYGEVLPLVEPRHDRYTAIFAGPNTLYLESDLAEGAPPPSVDFTVREGERVSFALSHAGAYDAPPRPVSTSRAERETMRYWKKWVSGLKVPERWRNLMTRSFITLKACTYEPTGGIVAAPTTSLPEGLGG